MKGLLILLPLLIALVSAQYEYNDYMGPPRMYMIGGQLGYMGRPLPHIRYGGMMTAPPEVQAVRGRIFT